MSFYLGLDVSDKSTHLCAVGGGGRNAPAVQRNVGGGSGIKAVSSGCLSFARTETFARWWPSLLPSRR